MFLSGVEHFFYFCQMRNPVLLNWHPLMQLLMLALLAILGFFVFMAIGIISSLVMFSVSFQDLLSGLDFNDPGMIPILKNLQIWQSLGIFFVPSLVLAWMASARPWSFLGLKAGVRLRPVIWVLLLLAVSMPLMNQLITWNQNMTLPDFMSGIEEWIREREDIAAELTGSFLMGDNTGVLLVNILMIALIPAFGEEFFFRGVMQSLLGRWFRNTHLAVILASILFSALHFQFYGFLPRFVLGLILGYLFAWTGNLWYPVLAHFFNNLLPVMAYYFYGEEVLESMDKMGASMMSWIWVGLSIFLSAIALYQIKQLCSRPEKVRSLPGD